MEKNLAAKTNETLRQVQTQFNCAMESHPKDCKCFLCDNTVFDDALLPPLIPPLSDADAFYRRILQTDRVCFAFVQRKISVGLPTRKYVGIGHTYTEAILKAYEKVHEEEAHKFSFSRVPCPICDLQFSNKIIPEHCTADEISVAVGNLFDIQKEHV